jgi:Secretion system C-terminal sorting domain
MKSVLISCLVLLLIASMSLAQSLDAEVVRDPNADTATYDFHFNGPPNGRAALFVGTIDLFPNTFGYYYYLDPFFGLQYMTPYNPFPLNFSFDFRSVTAGPNQGQAVIGGTQKDEGNGTNDFWFGVLDIQSGNMTNSFTHNISPWDTCFVVTKADDGYNVAGTSNNQAVALRLDENFNIDWFYPGIQSQAGAFVDIDCSQPPDTNNFWIAVGYANFGQNDVLIATKLDSAGHAVSTYEYDSVGRQARGTRIIPLPPDPQVIDYLVGGYTYDAIQNRTRPFVARLDGETLIPDWEFEYEYDDHSRVYEFRYDENENRIDCFGYGQGGNSDGYDAMHFRLDASNGNSLWHDYYRLPGDQFHDVWKEDDQGLYYSSGVHQDGQPPQGTMIQKIFVDPPLLPYILPQGNPVIPPNGGQLQIEVGTVNRTFNLQQYDAWISAVHLPSLNSVELFVFPNRNFPPLFPLSTQLPINVPANAPPGPYQLNVYLGDHPWGAELWGTTWVEKLPGPGADNFTVFEHPELWAAEGSDAASFGLDDDAERVLSGDSSVPSSYGLSNAYPNPFNPSTTLSVNLPESAELNVSVFNVTGQLVATLANSQFSAGSHTLTFNASSLSGGVYFVQASAQGWSDVQKVVLMK